ncbi:hypothetical protein QOT17_019997 [Balamuthia mandrillaris]
MQQNTRQRRKNRESSLDTENCLTNLKKTANHNPPPDKLFKQPHTKTTETMRLLWRITLGLLLVSAAFAAPTRRGVNYGSGDVSYDGDDVTYDGGDVSYDGGDVTYDGGDVSYDGGDVSYDGGDVSYGDDVVAPEITWEKYEKVITMPKLYFEDVVLEDI